MELDEFKKKELLIIGIFIGLIIFILFDFGWVIPLGSPVNIGTTPVSSIPIIPVLMSFILLIPLLIYAYHRPHDLKHYQGEDLRSIMKVFLLVYSIIMVFRTIVLLRYGLPLEKMPMIYLVGLQIIFVECYYLSDFGYHMDKLWRNIFFTFVLLAVVGVLLGVVLGGIILGLSIVGMIDLNWLFSSSSISINWYVVASFPFQLICVGVSEELLFRGYFYTKLRSTNLGYVKSILVSSIFFGLFHVCWYISPFSPWFISTPDQMVFHVAYTFIFGVCMCIIYERTKSLVAPLIIHGLGNSFGGAISTSTFLNLPIMPLYAEIWLAIIAAATIIPLFIIFVIKILPRLTRWIGVEAD